MQASSEIRQAQPSYSGASSTSKKAPSLTPPPAVTRSDTSDHPLTSPSSQPTSQRSSSSSSSFGATPSSSSSSYTQPSSGSSGSHPSSGGSGGGGGSHPSGDSPVASGSSCSTQPQSSSSCEPSSSASLSGESGGQTSSSGADSVSEESANISLFQQTPSPTYKATSVRQSTIVTPPLAREVVTVRKSVPVKGVTVEESVPTKASTARKQVTIHDPAPVRPSLPRELSEEATVENSLTMEQSVEPAAILNDSIFDNIQSSEDDDSEVEVIDSKDVGAKQSASVEIVDSESRAGDPRENAEEDLEDTLIYMDVEAAPSPPPSPSPPCPGSPELLQDFSVTVRSRAPPLQSPAKFEPDSSSGDIGGGGVSDGGGVSEGEESCVVNDSQVSLQLHFSQSQESFSFTPVPNSSHHERMDTIQEAEEERERDRGGKGVAEKAGVSEEGAKKVENGESQGSEEIKTGFSNQVGVKTGLSSNAKVSEKPSHTVTAPMDVETQPKEPDMPVLNKDVSADLIPSPQGEEALKEPLYESIRYDDEDEPMSDLETSNLSDDNRPGVGEKGGGGEEGGRRESGAVGDQLAAKASFSQVSEISQLTGSSGKCVMLYTVQAWHLYNNTLTNYHVGLHE